MALSHEDIEGLDGAGGLDPFEDSNVAYLQYIEAQGAKGISPLSQEGVELQARYLLQLNNNDHPLDILRRISVNPFAQPKDRIAASRTMLEYMARKVPATLEVAGPDGKAIQIDNNALKKLSGEDLEVLVALLEKVNK